MNVKIFRPSRNAMQSGRGKTSGWILEHEDHDLGGGESLMGWSAAADTLNQVRLKFDSCDAAVAFAEKKSWDYTVLTANDRRVKPKNYSDNFK
ncbi:MAG: oxidoreductase [Alphaproteobacteria bacterium]|nr:MAG: oxidoreductase [Alphaproteobacteria bacterium]